MRLAVDLTCFSDIRRYLRARRLRAGFFGDQLFADPNWDMLLDLYAAEEERRLVSVSSLCIAAAVPPTTALRQIGLLDRLGWVERQRDRTDQRRHFVILTGKAREAMSGYLAALGRLH